MSADPVAFHSSEANDPGTLAPGWYIGFLDGSDTITTRGAIGPYESAAEANQDIKTGAYIAKAGDFPQPIEERIGNNLAAVLGMKREPGRRDRWQTAWGTKTGAGLLRMLRSKFLEIERGNPDADLLK